jgi:hypothetical protein
MLVSRNEKVLINRTASEAIALAKDGDSGSPKSIAISAEVSMTMLLYAELVVPQDFFRGSFIQVGKSAAAPGDGQNFLFKIIHTFSSPESLEAIF